MYFALVYELNNREFNNMLLLKRELIRRGHEVDIFNKNETIVIRHKHGICLIPNSYNSADIERYRYVFNTKENILVNSPCEQVVNRRMPNFYENTDESPVKKLETLCWGQDYYEFVNSLGYKKELCHITGAIQLDFCRKEFQSLLICRKELAKEFALDPDKKWVLFISDLVYTNQKVVDHNKKANIANPDVLDNEMIFENRIQAIIIKWFETFIEKYPDSLIIYRKHQIEIVNDNVLKLESKYPNRFKVIDKYNIKNWIQASDRILNYNSTAAAECVACGKGNAIIRPEKFPDNIKMVDNAVIKSFIRVTSYDEMEYYILNEVETKKDYECISFFYEISDKPAFIRVADELEKIALKGGWYNYGNGIRWAIDRWKYLIVNKNIFKVIAKKIYQFCFRIFRFHESKVRGVSEWQKSVMNKQNEKTMSIRLDSILSKYYSL